MFYNKYKPYLLILLLTVMPFFGYLTWKLKKHECALYLHVIE